MAGCVLSTGQFSSVIEVQVQEPKKHHYLPKIYLSAWCGTDGRLERYVNRGGRIHTRRFPRSPVPVVDVRGLWLAEPEAIWALVTSKWRGGLDRAVRVPESIWQWFPGRCEVTGALRGKVPSDGSKRPIPSLPVRRPHRGGSLLLRRGLNHPDELADRKSDMGTGQTAHAASACPADHDRTARRGAAASRQADRRQTVCTDANSDPARWESPAAADGTRRAVSTQVLN